MSLEARGLRRGSAIAMGVFSSVAVGGVIALAALLVAGVALMYSTHFYFPWGHGPYAEGFMDLDEVKALYRAYPTAEPDVESGGYVMYTATSEDWSGRIDLVILHKRHTFDVFGMRLTCWDGGGGPPVWSVDEDILHHIESRRCF